MFMTQFAGYIHMLAFQFKISFAVIEVFYTSNNGKRFIIMALSTILTKFIRMGIFVAVSAIGRLYTASCKT